MKIFRGIKKQNLKILQGPKTYLIQENI